MPTVEDVFFLKRALERQLVNYSALDVPLEQFYKETCSGKISSLAEILERLGVISKTDAKSLQEDVQKSITSIISETLVAIPQNFKLDDCQRESVLGKSSLGTTYKIFHKDMGTCSLKSLEGPIAQNRKFLRRFFVQIEKLTNLTHSNIAKVYLASHSKMTILREFIEGQSLAQTLAAGPVTTEKACDIVLQAAKGLEFATCFGILHKNLKPDNILLTQESQVKILDFSLPPTIADYLAPEQCQRQKSDIRSDIYALGAIFYHILTGQTLFSGEDTQKIMQAHIEESYQPLRDFCEVSDQVHGILTKMLEKSPANRYQNYTDLISDLEELLPKPQEQEEKGEEDAFQYTTDMATIDLSKEPQVKEALHTTAIVGGDYEPFQEEEAVEAEVAEEVEAMEAEEADVAEMAEEAEVAEEVEAMEAEVAEEVEAMEAEEAVEAEEMEAMEAEIAEGEEALDFPEDKDFEADFSESEFRPKSRLTQKFSIAPTRAIPKISRGAFQPVDNQVDPEEWGPGLKGDDPPQQNEEERPSLTKPKAKLKPYFARMMEVKETEAKKEEKEEKEES